MTKILSQAISQTLAWFSLQNSPLTFDELFERLHDVKITPQKLQAFLKTKPKNLIQSKNLITLKSQNHLISQRIQNQSALKVKWSLIQTHLPSFQKIPFLKALLISGSVSAGNPTPDSDIDLFIVTQKNRIWLSRLFFLLFLKSHHLLRQEQKNQISDLFCPNHFISENQLLLKPHNIFTAHLFSQFAPIVNPALCQKFTQTNLPWIQKFLPNSTGQTKPPFQPVPKLSSFWEILLFGPFGFLAELVAKILQLQKIKQNPSFSTQTKRGGLKFSATELTFHGDPHEPKMLEKFSQLQKSLSKSS